MRLQGLGGCSVGPYCLGGGLMRLWCFPFNVIVAIVVGSSWIARRNDSLCLSRHGRLLSDLSAHGNSNPFERLRSDLTATMCD